MPRGVMDKAARRRLARELDESKARQVVAAEDPRAAIEALVRGGEGREAAGEDASAAAAPAAAHAVAVAPRAAATAAASAVQPAVRLASATTEQEAKGSRDTVMQVLTEATAALGTGESSDVLSSPVRPASTLAPAKDTPVKQHLDEDGEMHSKRGAKTASPSPHGGREIDEDVNLPGNNHDAVEASGDEPPPPPELVRSKKKGRGPPERAAPAARPPGTVHRSVVDKLGSGHRDHAPAVVLPSHATRERSERFVPCPVCKQYYDSADEANACANAHFGA